MSIYATLREARVDGQRVWVQGVPGHIDYIGPEWEFLGPPVQDENALRTVFIVDKHAGKIGQRYEYWLLQLTPDEYLHTPWPQLRRRIRAALRTREQQDTLSSF